MTKKSASTEIYIYLGVGVILLLVVSTFFLYVSQGLENARESALLQAKESLKKTYLILNDVHRNESLPRNLFISNKESDEFTDFSNEMAKSTPGWVVDEKIVETPSMKIAYRILAPHESDLSSELKEMLIHRSEQENEPIYELEHATGILQLTALLNSGDYIVLTSYNGALFRFLAKIERHSNMLLLSTAVVIILIIYITYLLFHLQKKEAHLESNYESRKSDIEKIAMVDALTGALSRRKFDEALREFLYLANNFNYHFSLILFDIDNFKSINDTYGHDAGDEVLVGIASHVKASIRKSDLFARWGGEEFIVVTPMLELPEAVRLADKLRKGIAEISFKDIGNITCSFGVSEYLDGCNEESLFKQADTRLYEAKQSGKNRVIPKIATEGEDNEYESHTR